MGVQRTSFEKLQRDRAKKAKAAAKREKRLTPADEETNAGEDAALAALADGESELSAADLLILIEQIHKQFDAEEIDFEEFEERKTELLSRLPVD